MKLQLLQSLGTAGVQAAPPAPSSLCQGWRRPPSGEGQLVPVPGPLSSCCSGRTATVEGLYQSRGLRTGKEWRPGCVSSLLPAPVPHGDISSPALAVQTFLGGRPREYVCRATQTGLSQLFRFSAAVLGPSGAVTSTVTLAHPSGHHRSAHTLPGTCCSPATCGP